MVGLEDLKTMQLLSELQPSALEAIKGFVRERSFNKGEVIFLQDEPCEAIYFVKAGQVQLCRLSPEGKEQTLCIKKPREFFCPVPILNGEAHLATALALTKVSLYVISRADIMTIGRDYPEMLSAIQSTCIEELRRLGHLVEELACKGVRERLARVLLEQSVGEGAEDNGRVTLTQKELASLVGTRQEVVSRTLRIFRKEGIIRVGRGQITILDRKRLMEFL